MKPADLLPLAIAGIAITGVALVLAALLIAPAPDAAPVPAVATPTPTPPLPPVPSSFVGTPVTIIHKVRDATGHCTLDTSAGQFADVDITICDNAVEGATYDCDVVDGRIRKVWGDSFY